MIRNITLKRRKNRIEYEIRICIRTPIEAVSQNLRILMRQDLNKKSEIREFFF